MQFISFRILIRRIKAIKSMMRDKTVPKRKKALVVAGIIYLFLPIDLIPPVLFPFGFLDDLVLWIWIVWTLKDTLDLYWDGEKEQDFSGIYKNSCPGKGQEPFKAKDLLGSSSQSLLQRIGELIGAGSGLEAAAGTTEPLDDILSLHADHDPGDTQQVAGAAALDDTALNDAVFIYIHSHFTGAYALGLVNIYHKKFLLWITSDSCIPLKEHS